MRPEISAITKMLYPELKDEIRVMQYPDVRGVNKNVYFFDHEQNEQSDQSSLSKRNDYEA